MKKMLIMVLLMVSTTAGVVAEEGFKDRPITNNVMMPTGFTMNKNEFSIGLGSIRYGLTNNVELGTNVLLYLFQVYNGDLKIGLVKSESMGLAAGIDFAYFNLKVFEADSNFTSFSPYVTISPKISEKTTLHLGGRYSVFSGDDDIEDAEASSTSKGTSFSVGLEYSLSHKTKFLTEGGYDFTFKGFRLGGAVLFGWEKFRLKLGVTYFDPENMSGFTFPVIGLWWRFNGL